MYFFVKCPEIVRFLCPEKVQNSGPNLGSLGTLVTDVEEVTAEENVLDVGLIVDVRSEVTVLGDTERPPSSTHDNPPVDILPPGELPRGDVIAQEDLDEENGGESSESFGDLQHEVERLDIEFLESTEPDRYRVLYIKCRKMLSIRNKQLSDSRVHNEELMRSVDRAEKKVRDLQRSTAGDVVLGLKTKFARVDGDNAAIMKKVGELSAFVSDSQDKINTAIGTLASQIDDQTGTNRSNANIVRQILDHNGLKSSNDTSGVNIPLLLDRAQIATNILEAYGFSDENDSLNIPEVLEKILCLLQPELSTPSLAGTSCPPITIPPSRSLRSVIHSVASAGGAGGHDQGGGSYMDVPAPTVFAAPCDVKPDITPVTGNVTLPSLMTTPIYMPQKQIFNSGLDSCVSGANGAYTGHGQRGGVHENYHGDGFDFGRRSLEVVAHPGGSGSQCVTSDYDGSGVLPTDGQYEECKDDHRGNIQMVPGQNAGDWHSGLANIDRGSFNNRGQRGMGGSIKAYAHIGGAHGGSGQPGRGRGQAGAREGLGDDVFRGRGRGAHGGVGIGVNQVDNWGRDLASSDTWEGPDVLDRGGNSFQRGVSRGNSHKGGVHQGGGRQGDVNQGGDHQGGSRQRGGRHDGDHHGGSDSVRRDSRQEHKTNYSSRSYHKYNKRGKY